MIYFLIPYSLIFLFLALKNLKWAVYLICFTLPAYLIRFQIGPLPMTVLEGEILILFVVWILRYITTPSRCCGAPLLEKEGSSRVLYYSITLLLITSFVSIFVSPNLRSALGTWRAYFLEPFLFFIVFISIIKKEDLKRVFLFLCFNAFMLSCFAIYQKFTGVFISNPFWSAEATRRVTSVFPYPNALALYLAPLVVAMIGVLITNIRDKELETAVVAGQAREKEKKKFFIFHFSFFILLLVACLLSLVAIYFTKSKGALLAILAGIIFYAIFFKGRRKIFVMIIIMTFISLFLYIVISGVSPQSMLKGNSTVVNGDSISTRLDMWRETWAMLKTRPLLGAGLAGYQTAVAPFHQKNYIEIYLYPHNIFLNFWSEIGLFGLLAFLGIVVWFYRAGFKKIRDMRYELGIKTDNQQPLFIIHYSLFVILLAALTALLIHGLVDVPYFKNDLSVLFWVVVGVMVVSTQIDTNKNTN